MRKILALLLLLPTGARAADEAPSALPPSEVKTLVASGRAAITLGAAEKAREDAVADALRNAIEQGIGLMLSSSTLVQNAQTVKDQIYTKVSGYVTGYEVLASEAKNDIMTVRVRAGVATGKLEEDLVALQLLNLDMEMPRIAVLMRERAGGPDGRGEMIANAVADPLLAKSFHIVDDETIRSRLKDEAHRRIIAGDAEAAISAGDQLSCEYVLTGTGEASAGAPDNDLLAGMMPIRASATAKVIRTSNGKLLATLRQQKGGPHAVKEAGEEQYLADACKALGEEAAAKLSTAWQDELNNGGLVQVSVFPLDHDRLQQVKDALLRIPRVVGVFQRDFTENGAAKLEVKFRGRASLLSQRIRLADFGKFSLAIAKERPHALELRVKPKA